MKRIKLVLSLFVIMLVYSVNAQVSSQVGAKPSSSSGAVTTDAPIMTFEKTVHDWGIINEGDVVETDFVFTNTGKTPLVITKIKGSCGCTVPSNWKKEPIAPGETSKFHVKFNSRNKPNRQQKTVSISCNTQKKVERVRIKAQVTPDPKMVKIREERAAKRKEAYAKRKLEKEKLGAKVGQKPSGVSLVSEKNTNNSYDKEKKMKEQQKIDAVEKAKELNDKEKAIKKNEEIAKSIKKDRKKTEKDRKKAEKAADVAKKESGNIKKAAKKHKKLQSKVASAERNIQKRESKIAKMKHKLERLTRKGKLSPENILKRETAIQKAESKVKKSTLKLKKLRRKL